MTIRFFHAANVPVRRPHSRTCRLRSSWRRLPEFHFILHGGFELVSAGGVLPAALFPMPQVFDIIWQTDHVLAGGSCGVPDARHGPAASVGGGARLGWITGVFCFVSA